MSDIKELQSMLSTAILAIHELNTKYDNITMKLNEMGAGYDINTIISNSLSAVSELSSKHDNLSSQLSSHQSDLQNMKISHQNLNAIISNSVTSIQELHKKHSNINDTVLQLHNSTNTTDINTIITSAATQVQDLTNKHNDIVEQIKILTIETTKPRPLDPILATMITNSYGGVKDLTQKYNELSYKINVLNNKPVNMPILSAPIQSVDIDMMATLDARLKKIEELLNIN